MLFWFLKGSGPFLTLDDWLSERTLESELRMHVTQNALLGEKALVKPFSRNSALT